MKVVSWNVNSIKVRETRVKSFCEREAPDILCLQELKCVSEDFPLASFEELGYHCSLHGQKTYNGVAILSKQEPLAVKTGFDDSEFDKESRLIQTNFGFATVFSAYVPNGQEVGSEKYLYKLKWLKRFKKYLDENFSADQPVIVCGDFNVAPEDGDVYDPEAHRGNLLFSEPEKKALNKFVSFGFKDVFREHNSDSGLYSWWDYRALGFQLNKGMRIDFVFATEGLSSQSSGSWIERNERKGEKPSDHAPVVAEFNLET